MKITLALLCLIISGFIVLPCKVRSEQLSIPQNNYLTYENRGITIQYPNNWYKLENYKVHGCIVDLVTFSPTRNGSEGLSIKINTSTVFMLLNATLDHYIEKDIDVDNMTGWGTRFNLTHLDYNSILSGQRAFRLVYTQLDEEGRKHMIMEVGTFGHGLSFNTLYYLKYVASPKNFYLYAPIVDHMLNSFTLSEIVPHIDGILYEGGPFSIEKINHVPEHEVCFGVSAPQ